MKNSFIFFALCVSVVNTGIAQTWQQMTKIPLALSYPVVVVLNGHIHVIGGGATGGATNIHLRYKPALNKWDTLAPVPYLAQQPAGAVVMGKIHFCGGGYPNSGTRLDKHFVYNADSNKWYTAAKLPVATVIHKAASLDNKLFILSGQPDKQLCEIYDPITDSWSQKNPLPDQHFWYSAIKSNQNTIFRFGGGGFTAPQKLAHQYDTATDSWIPLPDLPLALHGLDGAIIYDSLIYLSGGYNGGEKDFVRIYNMNTKTYYMTEPMPLARTYHNLVSIDSCLYSVGGNNDVDANVITSLLKFCPGNSPLALCKITHTQPYHLIRTPELFILEFDLMLKQPAHITVMDMTGKSIYKERSETGHIKLESRHFTSSLYIIHIQYNGHDYMEKWVVAN